MKLKLKSAEEFRRLLTTLLDDLVDARFHFRLHQDLDKAIEEYGLEFSQSPTFWNLTRRAHIDAALIRLCKAYDTNDQPALNLRNLLDTVQAHLSIFNEPDFRERLKGNAFVDSLAAELKPPDHAQLEKDIRAVSVADPLVKKLVIWRHNYLAHRNSDYALNPSDLSSRYPPLFTEIDTLLNRALEVGNRYSLLFDASVCSTMMVGRDDYLNVLEAVREHVQASQRRLNEHSERLGAATISK